MGASYPIIHDGYRCRRPDLDAHQMPPCRLAQSLEEVCKLESMCESTERTADLSRQYHARFQSKYPTCGFRNQVGTVVQWNWSHVPLWVISGHRPADQRCLLCLQKRT